MALTLDQVKKVAKLANLPLTKAEERTYTKQLAAIVDYVEVLEKVDTKNIKPTFNVSGRQIRLETKTFKAGGRKIGDRIEEVEVTISIEDAPPRPSLPQKAALQNSPQKKAGYFVTKGVFEEE